MTRLEGERLPSVPRGRFAAEAVSARKHAREERGTRSHPSDERWGDAEEGHLDRRLRCEAQPE